MNARKTIFGSNSMQCWLALRLSPRVQAVVPAPDGGYPGGKQQKAKTPF